MPDVLSNRRLIHMNKFRSRKYRELQLIIKGSGEMFGHEEILEKLKARRSSCVCVSPIAEVYFISDKDFQKRIPNPETWKYLNDTHNLKTNWEKYRMNKLLKVEEYKDTIAFNPSETIKPKALSSTSPTNRDTRDFRDNQTPRETQSPIDITICRSVTPSKESNQLKLYKEVVRLRRRTLSKKVDPLSESQGSGRVFQNSKSIYNTSLKMRSMTPGPNPVSLETKSPHLDNFISFFRTEVIPEEFTLLSKIKKQRKPPPNFLPNFKEEEMLQIRSTMRESPIGMPLNSYTPTKLKPSRYLKRRFN